MHRSPPSRARVLIVRCCRHPQFVAALARTRALHPDAEFWALAPERFRDELLAAGIDRVVTHDAARLGVVRLGLPVLSQLRRLNVSTVVLPLMDGQLLTAANVLRLAAAIAAPTTIIVPGDGELVHADRSRVRRLALLTTLGWPEGARVLWQMLVAGATARRPALATAPLARRRVLHIVNSLGVGGAQTQLAELVNHTPASAFTIDILVLDGGATRGRLNRDDVRVLALPACPHLGTVVDRILTVCRQGQYDIVHTWLPVGNMCGTAAARIAGVPRIITSVRSLNPGRYPQWCQWWFRPADVLAARLADIVTVNATALAADHGRWALYPAKRIQVVHNGLQGSTATSRVTADDVADERGWLRTLLGIAPDALVVGTVGRLADEKDQGTFLRAVAEVRRKGHHIHAVVVGDGPCGPALRELAEALRLSPHLTFLGDRRDSRRVIGGLDLLMLTSLIEGFPNVLLEAGLRGTPVLSSDVGGVRDVVAEPESRFAAGNAAAAAAALADALENPAATAARARRLRERCGREFTTERMVARWLTLYDAAPAPEPAALTTKLPFRGRGTSRPLQWNNAIEGEPQ